MQLKVYEAAFLIDLMMIVTERQVSVREHWGGGLDVFQQW